MLLPELFQTQYFPKSMDPANFQYANNPQEAEFLDEFCSLAAQYNVVLPISFFEEANNAHYNSVAMINTNGTVLGTYRKSHIPQAPDYEEKFYFSPGDTGFKVWETEYGSIGVAICWDQWFPEAARCMALQGADLLLYPTAIGSGGTAQQDTKDRWQRSMIGHAVANVVPVAAANRIGTESNDETTVTYYGSSFVVDHLGNVRAEASRDSETILTQEIDLQAAQLERDEWGVFRDRQPHMYQPLLTQDGMTPEQD